MTVRRQTKVRQHLQVAMQIRTVGTNRLIRHEASWRDFTCPYANTYTPSERATQGIVIEESHKLSQPHNSVTQQANHKSPKPGRRYPILMTHSLHDRALGLKPPSLLVAGHFLTPRRISFQHLDPFKSEVNPTRKVDLSPLLAITTLFLTRHAERQKRKITNSINKCRGDVESWVCLKVTRVK